MTDTARVRVAVVGCGLVAQSVHLPSLDRLTAEFELVAVCDPYRSVADGLAARYRCATFTHHEELLERAAPELVLIASPPQTHADIACAALAAGSHVFCEKPVAITLGAIDRMIAARDAAGRAVQVGYMKRFDPAYEAAVADAEPDDAASLRYVSVVAYDPEYAPYIAERSLLRGRDIPAELLASSRRAEAEQVEEAVADASRATIEAFVGGYLGSLVHHLNVVTGLLGAMGEPAPLVAIAGDVGHAGQSIHGSLRLASGARADLSWIQLLALHEHEERFTFLHEDGVRSLVFPSPWLRQAPTTYQRARSVSGRTVTTSVRGHEEAFERQLVHLHAVIRGEADARNTLEEARADVAALTAMYRAAAAT